MLRAKKGHKKSKAGRPPGSRTGERNRADYSKVKPGGTSSESVSFSPKMEEIYQAWNAINKRGRTAFVREMILTVRQQDDFEKLRMDLSSHIDARLAGLKPETGIQHADVVALAMFTRIVGNILLLDLRVTAIMKVMNTHISLDVEAILAAKKVVLQKIWVDDWDRLRKGVFRAFATEEPLIQEFALEFVQEASEFLKQAEDHPDSIKYFQAGSFHLHRILGVMDTIESAVAQVDAANRGASSRPVKP